MTELENGDRGGVDAPDPARVSVRNVGGITECALELPPGITVLSGRNATNRTSLLSALVGVLGGETATLKSDAGAGDVELHLDGNTYTRSYARQGEGVTTTGTPVHDDAAVVDLFVGLTGSNTARRAVQRGEDLRAVVMRPVDTDEIQRRIRETEREKQRIESELDDIERQRDRLPALEKKRTGVETDLAEVTAELDAVREAIAAYDASEAEAQRAEALLDEMEDLRRERDRLDEELGTQRTSVEALRDERAEIRAELDELTVDDEDLDELEREIEGLRTRKRELEDLISDLSAIVDLNDDLVQSESIDLPGIDAGSGDPTSALDPTSAEIECWTCGSQIPKRAVADRLDDLRAVIEDQRETRRRVADDLDEAEERRDEIRAAADAKADLERRLRETDRQIERREERLQSLKADRQRVQADIEQLETRFEETDDFEDEAVVDQYQRLSDLEYERGQLEQRLADLDREIDEIEGLADEKRQLESQRADLGAELEALRSRIEDLERSAVEQFNDRMTEVLDLLGYGNLERVWIERKTDAGGRERTGTFDLHVVRESSDGAVYEDTVDTLSESEREVIGLVFALAGYLVHEVHAAVPFMLLDSLEAIDAGRINDLLEYFADYAPYLVVALLPEDADAIDVDHTRITADALGT
jgi:DNA repair ATPase RecN